MSKYGEALGIWEITIGGANLKVKPRKGDNLELMNIFKAHKNQEEGFERDLSEFLFKIISRDEPPQSDLEREELEQYIEFNFNQLLKELMIKFRWASRETLDQAESDALKKNH